MRHYSLLDRIITRIDTGFNTVFSIQSASRPNPANDQPYQELSPKELRCSQGFMRVNHSGEVCAQALYRGQLVFAQNEFVHKMLIDAAIEETDHLAWTHQRLQELKTHRSYLNIFWYINSFCIGLLASKLGDQWSLGFIEETERQVSAHLTGHLDRLGPADLRSRNIVLQMRDDEEHHWASAKQAGAIDLPVIVKTLMRLHAKVLTTVAYYV